MVKRTNPEFITKHDIGASVAAAGNAKASAAALALTQFQLTTAADGTKGVILPVTTINRDEGIEMVVVNTAASALLVYPQSATGTINGGAGGASLSVAAGKTARLVLAAVTSAGVDTWWAQVG